MTPIQAIALGALQGLTEFFPISSSGHLILVPALFNWQEQGLLFDVTVHLGTLGAIILAMRREIASLIKGVKEGVKADRSLVYKIAVATIPAVAFGGLLPGVIDSARTVSIVAAMLIVWGVLLAISDYLPKKRTIDARRVHDVTWRQAIIVGFAQAFALIPGTSRSGATMTVGLFSGLDRGQAARFSFLLAVPAILGAGAKTIWDAAKEGSADVHWLTLALGFASSLVFGVLAIRLLFVVIRKVGFLPFAIYRVALGILLFLVFIDSMTP